MDAKLIDFKNDLEVWQDGEYFQLRDNGSVITEWFPFVKLQSIMNDESHPYFDHIQAARTRRTHVLKAELGMTTSFDVAYTGGMAECRKAYSELIEEIMGIYGQNSIVRVVGDNYCTHISVYSMTSKFDDLPYATFIVKIQQS